MRDPGYDDPTIPPPGKRSGQGMWSIVPYLKKSLAAKPKARLHADDGPTLPAVSDSPDKKPK